MTAFSASRTALTLLALFGLGMGVSGCSKTVGDIWKEEAANRLAVPANLHKRQIESGPYAITVFARTYKRGAPAVIYIEGDGLDLLTTHEISKNPTPDYPLALHLATRDLNDNVIYMARPCQYSALAGDIQSTCPPEAYTGQRFGVEAMDAMNGALDELKRRYGLNGFHLVGYAGGAVPATLLAAKRGDVLSLRTVAGFLDTAQLNEKDPASQSLSTLNPRDFARDLATLPQHHFYGAWDKTVSPTMYQTYSAAMGPSPCTRMSVIDEIDHQGGWTNRWASLLKYPVTCGE